MSERENRDRLEALETRLKLVEAEAAFLRDVLKAKLDVPASEQRTAALVEWLGRRSEPVAYAIAVLATALPVLGASLWPTSEPARLTMLAAAFVWPIFGFFLVLGSYHTVRTLNEVRAVLRR